MDKYYNTIVIVVLIRIRDPDPYTHVYINTEWALYNPMRTEHIRNNLYRFISVALPSGLNFYCKCFIRLKVRRNNTFHYI